MPSLIYVFYSEVYFFCNKDTFLASSRAQQAGPCHLAACPSILHNMSSGSHPHNCTHVIFSSTTHGHIRKGGEGADMLLGIPYLGTQCLHVQWMPLG
jgi:hypothetical protein